MKFYKGQKVRIRFPEYESKPYGAKSRMGDVTRRGVIGWVAGMDKFNGKIGIISRVCNVGNSTYVECKDMTGPRGCAYAFSSEWVEEV